MSIALLLAIALLAPIAQAAAGLLRPASVRDLATIAAAAIGAVAAIAACGQYAAGARADLVAAAPLTGVTLAFRAEPLGLAMLALIGGLNALASVYTAAYRMARQERVALRTVVFSGLVTACAGAAVTSANLYAFFVAYVGLALATFPLIGSSGPAGGRAARAQLAWMLGPAVVFLLPAAVWTTTLAGDASFAVGGVLPRDTAPWIIDALVGLFALGLVGAGVMPAHRWQIEVAHAPTPIAMLVQSIAVAPVGAIGFLKIAVGVFGAPALAASSAGKVVLALALVALTAAPLLALGRQSLSERLSYTTLAATAFVFAAAALGAQSAVLGAALQLLAHGLAKTTLLMAAGTIETATGRRDVARLGGLGQRMPWTFASLGIAALSLAGLAPAAGAWPLLWTVSGAGATAAAPVVAAFAAAAFFTFALIGPTAVRAFAEPPEVNPFTRPDGATLGCIAPTALAACATLGLVAFVDPLARFLITGLML